MTPALRDFLSNARLKRIPKGQILLYGGDIPTEIHLLKEGIVKLHNIDDQGNEKILHLLSPLTVLPLAFFSGERVATRWYYTTLTDCEAYTVSHPDLEQVMQNDWPTAKLLMNCFSEEVHEILVRLDSLGKTNIDTKLSITLRYLAVVHGTKIRGNWWKVNFPVNHQLLADIIGMSRESTAIAMKALADVKMVRYARGTSLAINLDKLLEHLGETVNSE